MVGGNFHIVFTALFLGVASIALFSFLAVAAWSKSRRKEREAYYKSENLKKIAETQGPGTNSALEFLREQEKIDARRIRERTKLGGLITSAVGIGMMIFLWALSHDPQEQVPAAAALVGLIPLLIGVAMLLYSSILAPKE